MGTIVYIDGFNLYYGAVKGTPHKWLDLESPARRLLPNDEITRIRYFTARISARPDDPQQAARQETYLRALNTLPLIETHFGHYVTRPTRMVLAKPPASGPRTVEVLKTEERDQTSIWRRTSCSTRFVEAVTRRSSSATTRTLPSPFESLGSRSVSGLE